MSKLTFPDVIQSSLEQVHPEWQSTLARGLSAIESASPGYLQELTSADFFPTDNRIFAAFSLPPSSVEYVLIGEGPYPRAESATGFAFMDGAVKSLWAVDGLGFSKTVNRATSLRNFLKMLCVTEGLLQQENTTGNAMTEVLSIAESKNLRLIQTASELQQRFLACGFLMLNASLVYRKHVAPVKDGRAWLPFLREILAKLSSVHEKPATLVLWGKIAADLQKIPESHLMPHMVSEHPYNLSFIKNQEMQDFFSDFSLLRAP